MRLHPLLAVACLVVLVPAVPVAAAPQQVPRLVVLAETGQLRDGLPVLRVHPDPAADVAILTRGLSGRLLRLYAYEQAYLQRREGRPVEPAYLLRSSQQGGFARHGFWLGGEDKRHAGYVDLHERQQRVGRFGASDQIFPHELAHVIAMQLVGEPAQGGSNQVHALGVRTDPVIAFHEGFAEHFQVLAVDDADADPATRAMASDPYWAELTEHQLESYRRAMTARWAPAASRRVGFMFWYSGAEQVLRYRAVKANSLARMPALPPRLLATSDPYDAYLLQSVMPGLPSGRPKPARVLLSTEGVVAALFVRWAGHPALGGRYREPAFYEQFGADAAAITPFENVYLKLFDAWHRGKPRDTLGAIASYKAAFPDEARLVDDLLGEVLLGQALPEAPELWLANPAFKVGTTLFDQFRGLPRVHTFDLNAATVVDLVGVPGVSPQLAEAILAGGPYPDLGALRAVPGMTSEVQAKFTELAGEMARLRSGADREGEGLSFSSILTASLKRALMFLVLAAAAGALLYRQVEKAGVGRSILAGLGAATLALLTGWVVDSSFNFAAAAVPLIVFACPAVLIRLVRTKLKERGLAASPLQAAPATRPSLGRLFVAWAAAMAPALLLMTPLF